MNIVVLDGYTLNPGDLSWDGMRQLGPTTVYERSAPAIVVERAREAEIVLTNKVVLDRATIAALPKLRYIGVLATGYNVVDIAAAKERGIPVTNTPNYGTASVAQHTFALLLELTHHVGEHARTVRDGQWTRCADFCYWKHPLVELDGLTMGIVGFGRIGRAVARLAEAYSMEVLVHARTPPSDLPRGHVLADVDSLFASSDVVSLHCPLTPDTKHLVNAARLARMKPGAFLLNTARGPLIDEPALADALNSGLIAGAGLDVLSIEPPRADNPLLTAKNCLITPHIGWGTRAARSRLMDIAVENVRAFIEGRPRNVVS